MSVSPTAPGAEERSAPEGVAIGLDVGGTTTRGVLLDDDGRVRADVEMDTRPGPDGVTGTAVEVARRLLADAQRATAEPVAIGVGVPGIVDPGTGTVRDAVNLGVTEPLALGARLRAELGTSVVAVENDLNAAVRGAARLVAPAGAADLVLLALGTGLAAGVMLDGVVRRGVAGAAGEIGHLVVEEGGVPCACGQLGCLERYVSGSALERRWPSRQGRPAPQELFEAARAGDPVAVEVVEELGAALATAVKVVALAYDVEHVLIGGGVSRLGAPLRDLLARHLDADAARSPFLARLGLPDRVALVPADAAVGPVGAALLGREAAREIRPPRTADGGTATPPAAVAPAGATGAGAHPVTSPSR